MKKIKILNAVFTGLFAALMFLSAVPDVLSATDAVKGMHGDLGYPSPHPMPPSPKGG